jgi:hypothetical protein
MFSNVLGRVPLRSYPAGFSKPIVHPLGPGRRAPPRGLGPVPRLAEVIPTDARPAESTEVDPQASAA